MSFIKMEVQGRFGHMLAAAMEANEVPPNKLAQKVQCTYEHVRKFLTNKALPSDIRLTAITKVLGLNYDEAHKIVTEERMKKKYGEDGLSMIGKTSRLAELEASGLEKLTKPQFKMLLDTVKGFSTANRKTGTGD